jgi:hypothetical protein
MASAISGMLNASSVAILRSGLAGDTVGKARSVCVAKNGGREAATATEDIFFSASRRAMEVVLLVFFIK